MPVAEELDKKEFDFEREREATIKVLMNVKTQLGYIQNGVGVLMKRIEIKMEEINAMEKN